jgi:putative peptide zinc metalloprotease protein
MSDSLFSPSWYRVADLKPKLRGHVEIHRHDYRGKVWYILQDHASGRSHRFSPAAYHFIGLLDGQRHQRHQQMQLKQRLWTPLAIRVPLLDPERFLERTLPFARLLINRYTAVVWLLIVLLGAVLAAVHWSDLTEDIVDRALTPGNLVLLWFIYPVVKALHELGHAYLAKLSGGEVHEIGIMFLVLMPVPYVDVSSTWGFRDKRKRMAVGA